MANLEEDNWTPTPYDMPFAGLPQWLNPYWAIPRTSSLVPPYHPYLRFALPPHFSATAPEKSRNEPNLAFLVKPQELEFLCIATTFVYFPKGSMPERKQFLIMSCSELPSSTWTIPSLIKHPNGSWGGLVSSYTDPESVISSSSIVKEICLSTSTCSITKEKCKENSNIRFSEKDERKKMKRELVIYMGEILRGKGF